jgi:hypothetical protein
MRAATPTRADPRRRQRGVAGLIGVTNRCQRSSSSWDLRGTSRIANGNTITFYGALVPAARRHQILGSATVTAGAWTFKLRAAPRVPRSA